MNSSEDPNMSDNDGGERPVRRKLQETSITPLSGPEGSTGSKSVETGHSSETSRSNSRGRKRSLEDQDRGGSVNDDDLEKMREGSAAGHRRKRSRDSKLEDEATETAEKNGAGTPPNVESKTPSDMMSPKKKRSRDQLDKYDSKTQDEIAEAVKIPENVSAPESARAEGEPEKKRHREDSREREHTISTKLSIGNAFSNTSTVSPFGSLGSPSEQLPKEHNKPEATSVPSSSEFSKSSLAAFASSETSPFGTIASNTTSVFKSTMPNTEAEKTLTTGFAAAANSTSSFASTGVSGFASLGAGFSAFSSSEFETTGQKGGLTSFASRSGPGLLGSSSKVKSFGAPEDEESENEKEEEETEQTTECFEKDKPDERFVRQHHIPTGEEDEKTYFSCKAKLYSFQGKEWRERGTGTFKVNVKEPEDNADGKVLARMIMRADGVLRLMLNSVIFKEMTVGDARGEEPKDKRVSLQGLEEGRSVPLLLRTASEDQAKQLYHVIRDLQKRL